MRRMDIGLHHKLIDENCEKIVKKCGLLRPVFIGNAKITWGERKKISMAIYLNEKSGKLYFPFCKDWNIKLSDVVTYTLYVKNGAYFSPFRDDLFLLENEDISDFYLLVLKNSEVQWHYDLELYHKEELVFSIKDVHRSFKPGLDLKIIYTTYFENKYRHWIYKSGEHVLLAENEECYSSNLKSEKLRSEEAVDILDIVDENGLLQYYFHYVNSKSFYIASEFAKSGDEFTLLDNQFADDDTLNYVVKYKPERLKDLMFIDYCASKNNNNFGGYAVFGIPISEYYKGLLCKEKYKVAREYDRIWEPCNNDSYYKGLVEQIYKDLKYEINYSTLPDELLYKEITRERQSYALSNYIQTQLGHAEFKIDFTYYKKQYDEIYDKLVSNGFVETKWKSEYALYTMLKKHYPDAIYQYRAPWLGHQSLDIYIPHLNLAFEYQGIQHYKPISVFGGETKFKQRLELDKIKKKLCETNGVRLILWMYDDPITKSMMLHKIQHEKSHENEL